MVSTVENACHHGLQQAAASCLKFIPASAPTEESTTHLVTDTAHRINTHLRKKGYLDEVDGMPVPPVLLSGNHGRNQAFRRRERLKRAAMRRPDLLLALWDAPTLAEQHFVHKIQKLDKN